MRTLSLVSACLTLFAANTATAQVYYPGLVHATRIHVASPHHASTAAESYARGYADVVRARAQYNLLTSQAMVNLAEARRRETDNRVAQTRAYFEMREINRRSRHGNRAARSPRDSVVSHSRLTQRPKEVESLKLQDGRIVWPKLLNDDSFQADRATVEQIVSGRIALDATAGADKVTQTSRAMELELRSRIREFSPKDYLAAKHFLTNLRRHFGENDRARAI
jgi:hypothetical protein